MSGGQESKVKKNKTTKKWTYRSLFGRDVNKGVLGCMTSCQYAYDSSSSLDATKQQTTSDGGQPPSLQMSLGASG